MNYDKLFNFMLENHGVTMLESDMDELVRVVLKSIRENIDSKDANITNLVTDCCEKIGISYSTVTGKSQKREIVLPRQAIMWGLEQTQLFTLKKIGLEFNGRDHSTVLHAKETINDLLYTKNADAIRCANAVKDVLGIK